MTATEKLKQKLVFMATGETLTEVAQINDNFEDLKGTSELGDAMSELRGGEEETGLPCEWDRNYESKAVAAQMLDGTYVGWTYWYGGGKHGDPDRKSWIKEAYDVAVEEVMKPVKVFRKVEARS